MNITQLIQALNSIQRHIMRAKIKELTDEDRELLDKLAKT